MGQYVVVENEGRYCFNLCASNGHILVTSIVFPSREECLQALEVIRRDADRAEIEDTTIDAFDREPSPKYRIYEDFDGYYFFRFITDEAGDIACSHSYEHKESLFRRIERLRAEADSPTAATEE